jgi:hypothetical protein
MRSVSRTSAALTGLLTSVKISARIGPGGRT